MVKSSHHGRALKQLPQYMCIAILSIAATAATANAAAAAAAAVQEIILCLGRLLTVGRLPPQPAA